MASLIRDMQLEERPRERLWQMGPESLKTSELIAILLRTGMQGRSALMLGEEIFQKYETLHELCKASALELSKIKGVGVTKAVQLKAAFELASRLATSKRKDLRITSSVELVQFLEDEMRMLSYESVRVVVLNGKGYIVAIDEVGRGNSQEAYCEAHDVFRVALLRGASAIVVAHNHPSGDPMPSEADLIFTQALKQGAEFLGVQLLDHLILGTASEKNPKGYFSFLEAELL